jgi:hypothetical protein
MPSACQYQPWLPTDKLSGTAVGRSPFPLTSHNHWVLIMFLDIFALVVIAMLLAVAIWLVVLLGNMPGDIARKRQHPQAEAISALGWIGIITMGLGWFMVQFVSVS